jgi:TrmH family RNA methyltransferase
VIAIRKLMSLSPGHRARKAAQTLELVERAYRRGDFSAAPWVQELASALAADPGLARDPGLTPDPGLIASAGMAAGLEKLLDTLKPSLVPAGEQSGSQAGPQAVQTACDPFYVSPLLLDPQEGIRTVNCLRRSLEALSGGAPADWDFMEPAGVALDAGVRSVFPGMRAFLEDIRSPFNVGSMFRTADAFGLAEILLSGFCADPGHPRAVRSAMGASTLLPWRRTDLESLGGYGEVFALELRGEPLDGFEFPEYGVVVLGSEELGVSPAALRCCSRRVSIPMSGAKGSLNVGVAFGVLLAAWSRNLQTRGIQPQLPSAGPSV